MLFSLGLHTMTDPLSLISQQRYFFAFHISRYIITSAPSSSTRMFRKKITFVSHQCREKLVPVPLPRRGGGVGAEEEVWRITLASHPFGRLPPSAPCFPAHCKSTEAVVKETVVNLTWGTPRWTLHAKQPLLSQSRRSEKSDRQNKPCHRQPTRCPKICQSNTSSNCK